MTPFFEETQRPPAFAMVALFAASFVAAAFGVSMSIRLDRFVWQPFLAPAFALSTLAFLRMTTRVEPQQLRVLIWPFPRKTFRFDEIDRCEAVTYRPFMEYGGWGWRRGRHATAYTMRGKRGVMLYMRNGKKFLVGSERPDDLVGAIDTARQVLPSAASPRPLPPAARPP